MKIFIIFLSLFSSQLSFSSIGACIHDPNAQLLQDKWKNYFELRVKRSKVNSKLLVKEIKMDQVTLQLLQAVSEIEKLLELVKKMEGQYFHKAFVDLRFNEMVSHPDFIQKILHKEIDQEIRNSDLKFKNDEQFYVLLEEIRAELAKKEVSDAIAFFRLYNLGILEKTYRKSAADSLKLLRKKGGTIEAVRLWQNDPPYLKNVPLPPKKLGPFATRYHSLVAFSVGDFVVNRKVNLAEAKKVFPRIQEIEVEQMNQAQPPTESNSFDDHIASLQLAPANAIDGVARTLWGEATSCQLQGLPQFEAIGRVIADRSMAVNRAINEYHESLQKSDEVRKQNWLTVLKNWIGINRPAPGLKNRPISRLRGLSDFGRKEKMQLHPAAQVISKKGQFSVWNSFSIKRFHTGKLHPNIPDGAYEIQGPQAENDDKALVRILCPQFQSEQQKNLWQEAVKFAEIIVNRPQEMASKIKWKTSPLIEKEILFYTHEASLPFAKEVQVPSIMIEGNPRSLRGKGRGPCHHFRLFIPKVLNQY